MNIDIQEKPKGGRLTQIKPVSVLIIIVICVYLCSCLAPPPIYAEVKEPLELPSKERYYLRVAVITDAKGLKLSLHGPYQIFTLYTHELLTEGKNLKKVKVRPTFSGMFIGDTHLKVFGVRIDVKRASSIYINNRRFRGSIDIIRERNRRLLVINHIDMEDYLYGVLYHEISHRWPLEAIKAQAVAARTFAIYQSLINADKDYDLTSDVYSQIYGGATSERRKTNRAVRKTKGEVLTFQGKVFPAYYHATCGGHTEDANLLWRIDTPPLKGRRCEFCQKSPHLHWRKKIKLRELEKKLNKTGLCVKGITSISAVDKDPSGRITELVIKDSKGKHKIPAKDFRIVLGVDRIRSTNFKVKLDSNYVYFEGIGWGHGVGLCQWGSYFMAKKRYSAEDILKFYYPGAEIVRIQR